MSDRVLQVRYEIASDGTLINPRHVVVCEHGVSGQCYALVCEVEDHGGNIPHPFRSCRCRGGYKQEPRWQ